MFAFARCRSEGGGVPGIQAHLNSLAGAEIVGAVEMGYRNQARAGLALRYNRLILISLVFPSVFSKRIDPLLPEVNTLPQ